MGTDKQQLAEAEKLLREARRALSAALDRRGDYLGQAELAMEDIDGYFDNWEV